ncbi:MAG TPA: urate hydroxylase PuuD [Terriglobales bacterium]|nr:urate hydroxylase PuuD [Terriglobales bacterium]
MDISADLACSAVSSAVGLIPALSAMQLSIPVDGTTNLLMILRWVHFIAGIAWVGLLYFFNLVSTPLFRELDPAVRGKVFPGLMSRTLWWFRWASVVTVFVGIWYWMKIVGTDARNAEESPGTAIWTFFAIWTLAFVIYMGVLMATHKKSSAGWFVGIAAVVVVIAASYLYVTLNSHGWESNRLLAIGVGGGMGWFMMFNVWGVVWRVQKRLIQWTAANAAQGTPMPAQAADYARLSLLAARTNFWLSFPMLFFMGAASHYPMFVGR